MAEPASLPRGAVHAWALYDFATTAFYMNFMSTYVALWVVQDLGGTDLQYGWAKSASMLAVALASPWLGAWSDRLGRTRPFLLVFTAWYLLGGLALGFAQGLVQALVLFALANVGLQLASVFYNAMLPTIAPPGRIGRVSGYGRAIGYVGSLVAVLVGMVFATGEVFGQPVASLAAKVGLALAAWPPPGNQAVFVPTVLLAGLAAVPLLFVRVPPPSAEASHGSLGIRRFAELVRELATDPRLRGAALFLVAGFLFFDTINTIRDFMSIYLVKVVGLSAGKGGTLQAFLLRVVLCSLVGALAFGWLADRIGPRRALLAVLSLLGVGFAGMVWVHTPALVLGVLGPIIGLAFGGVLVTARPLLARLVPAERRGEFFGLFVLANDFAAILGPLTWGYIVQALSDRGTLAYQVALGAQLAFLALGIAVLTRVPDGEPDLAGASPGR